MGNYGHGIYRGSFDEQALTECSASKSRRLPEAVKSHDLESPATIEKPKLAMQTGERGPGWWLETKTKDLRSLATNSITRPTTD